MVNQPKDETIIVIDAVDKYQFVEIQIVVIAISTEGRKIYFFVDGRVS